MDVGIRPPTQLAWGAPVLQRNETDTVGRANKNVIRRKKKNDELAPLVAETRAQHTRAKACQPHSSKRVARNMAWRRNRPRTIEGLAPRQPPANPLALHLCTARTSPATSRSGASKVTGRSSASRRAPTSASLERNGSSCSCPSSSSDSSRNAALHLPSLSTHTPAGKRPEERGAAIA